MSHVPSVEIGPVGQELVAALRSGLPGARINEIAEWRPTASSFDAGTFRTRRIHVRFARAAGEALGTPAWIAADGTIIVDAFAPIPAIASQLRAIAATCSDAVP